MRRFYPLLFLLLVSCSFTPQDTGTGFMFALSPIEIINQGPQNESLIVAMPTTAPELDTYRIALKRGDRQWDYYAGARWADFLPALVRDNLVKSLDHARIFKSVAADETGLQGERLMKTEIRAFQAEYNGGAAPAVKISLRVSLVARMDRRPQASFDVAVQRAAKENSLTGVQAAFAAAFNEAERQAVMQMGELIR